MTMKTLFLSAKNDARWRFIAYGGFLYFGAEGEVLVANAVGMGDGLGFGAPQPWNRDFTEALVKDSRLEPVTLDFLKNAGAKYYSQGNF